MAGEAGSYVVVVCWKQKVVVGPGTLATGKAAGACVSRVLKGLGLPEKRWAKLGPQVRVMHGFEAGGWCVLVLRGQALPRLTSAQVSAGPEALKRALSPR